MKGLYIAFEGGEGSGKSTQAQRLSKRLNGFFTREPGGTPLGQELRRLLLESEDLQVEPRAEALMMAADRAQHMSEVVLPTLETGQHVISDRSVYSSLAYQGRGRGLGTEEIATLNDWALAGRWPDLVVLLDVPSEEAKGRLDGSLDRIERESEDFHSRVHQGFRDLAQAEPDRWVIVSGIGSVDEVESRVWAAVSPKVAS